jgi:putative membrane protein
MGLMMLVVFGVIVAAVVAVVIAVRNTSGRPGPSAPTADDAQRILDRRFAAGEIDPEEYASRTEVLRRTSGR